MDFATTLLTWYDANKRDLPFRQTRDPYKIWLSEIILQQTRVEQGMPYYHSFTNAFSTITDLANAPEDAVMRLWQGLGYYSRARNLHQTAKIVAADYGGNFPSTYTEIATLKGIGPYTAGAIASIAFNEKAAAVDGNVYRFLSRYFGISTPAPSEKARKEFTDIVLNLMENHPPGTFNQALIEFGALQCKPSPPCMLCPFNATCYGLNKGKVNELPVKNKMAARRSRYFHYFIIKNQHQVLLQQRTAKDIWQQLYEFPLVETNNPHPRPFPLGEKGEDPAIISGNVIIDYLSKNKTKISHIGKPLKHVLSHQDLFTNFYVVEVKKLPVLDSATPINIADLDNYGLPRVITLFLESNPF
jgi:A/G-specific adenine glycosylase